MLRTFVGLFVFFAMFLTSTCESFASGSNTLEREVPKIITETTTVANFIKQAGGEKDANILFKRCGIVQQHYVAKNEVRLRIALQSLRAEVLRRHAYLNFALAKLVERQNSEKEIRALQFINRTEYLLKSIEKRINAILGGR